MGVGEWLHCLKKPLQRDLIILLPSFVRELPVEI